MLELVTALLEGFFHSPIVIGIGVAIVTAAGAWVHGRISGARKQKEAQAAEEAKARDIADQVDNDVGALPADQVRQELKTWEK
ncbi:ABC transporter permease [Mesorhizobium sp. M2A.F.Ca.ET.017.03.2.1]|uniref:ABC transporter permease n=1 Tax=unclassified Mesorhizobium TaxID=325217 RepID=UPI000FCBAB2A|nr:MULTISPECIES: ABC transporter permease [unclassified Mesorhizobium]RUW38972.1 ABC transporter permease [Mesorhizobium sp. M2A.F.Ca.ET.015.02.1.1]RVC95683.1 ABC transporter permease [Mesorhizobium sp. M2A.F.Ca.ET.017.03.2.1]